MRAKHLYEDKKLLKNLTTDKDEETLDFIQAMLSENLNHARHVENERLTYCTAATTLFGISTAFISAQSSYTLMNLILCIVMVGFIFLSMRVNGRWSNAFQRHLEYAKGCYFILHEKRFPDSASEKKDKDKAKEEIILKDTPDSSLQHLPLYCFNIQNPKIRFGYLAYNKRRKKLQIRTIGELEDKIRTHDYFKYYYWGLFVLSLAMLIVVAVEVLGGSGAEAAAACSCGPMFISYGGVLPPQL